MSSEIIPVSCDTEPTEERNECDHLWLNKAGADYRSNPIEVCAKCGEER